MTAKYIWEVGSMIFVILGSIHLVYTFFTDKFSSKNKKVLEEMESSYPILTGDTTIWKAWIGFNASHSAGAIFIGVVNMYIAHHFFQVIQGDYFFFAMNILTVGFYLWLAQRYWFRIPFYGILLTLVCFLTSFLIAL